MFYEPEKNEQFWEWDALFSLSPSLLPQKARRSTICIFIFLRLLATTPTFWWTISGFFATNLACYLNSIKMENSKIFTSFRFFCNTWKGRERKNEKPSWRNKIVISIQIGWAIECSFQERIGCENLQTIRSFYWLKFLYKFLD